VVRGSGFLTDYIGKGSSNMRMLVPFLCVFLRNFRYACQIVFQYALIYCIRDGEVEEMAPSPGERGFLLISGRVVGQRQVNIPKLLRFEGLHLVEA
jgi:hypothetical protein